MSLGLLPPSAFLATVRFFLTEWQQQNGTATEGEGAGDCCTVRDIQSQSDSFDLECDT